MPLLRVSPAGLFTDPNPFSAVPEGSLETASDVVMRRKGLLEQRPGFKANTTIAPGAGFNQAFRLITFGQDVLVVCNDEGTSNEKAFWLGTATEVFGGPVASTPFSAEYGRALYAKAREALYVGGDTFTYKLTSIADVQADAAGLPRAHAVRAALSVAAGTGMLAALSEVAYRVIWRRKDANGNVLRSSPSPRFIMRNGTGAANDVDVYVTIPVEIVAGDVAEVYRSDVIAFAVGSPDDELGLVKEYAIASGDKTNNFFTFTDTLPNNQRGAIYYAAPSQQGIQNANERPPLAKDLAYFADSMFYANVGGFEQMAVELRDIAGVTDADGFGYRSTTIKAATTWSSGAFTFNVTSTVGIVVGMAVSVGTNQPDAGGGNAPANTLVTGIAGDLITVDKAATGDVVAGTTVRFHDVLKITTSTETAPAVFYASDGWSAAYTGLSARSFPLTSAFADERLDIRDTSIALAHAIDSWLDASNYAHVPNVIRTSSDDPEASQGNMLWRARWPGTAHRFAVTGTHQTAFVFRNNGTVSASNWPMSSADEGQNILFWSKFNQPEAVPVLNYTPVGAENDPILRILALSDAMYVFKLSGEVYRVTGAGADAGFRLDLVNASCRLLSWNCADVLNDQIVVWSAEGVGLFTENGLVRIDLPIRNVTEPFTRYYSPNESTAPGANTSGAVPYVFCNDRVNEIVLGIPSTDGSAETCALMYVFNVNTNAWTSWERASRTMGAKASGALLFSDGAAAASTFTLYEERIANLPGSTNSMGAASTQWYDEEYTGITVSSVSPNDSTLITIAGGSGWSPIAGDAFIDNGTTYLVVGVSSTTVFYVDRAGVTTGGSRTARVGIGANLVFREFGASSPAILAAWGQRVDEFSSFFGCCRIRVGCASNWTNGATTQSTLARTFQEDTVPAAIRSTIPRDAAKAVSIKPDLYLRQAMSRWAYAGLAIEATPLSIRGTRDMEETNATGGAVVYGG